MKADDLMRGVISPTLGALKMRSWQAEQIVLGTAIAESNLESLYQIGGGPARGLWQIEPFTARDVLRRYLGLRIDLRLRLKKAVYPLGGVAWWPNWSDDDLSRALRSNLALGAAVCRLIYLWVPEPIPDTLEGQAEYHKTYFNKGGAATVEHYINAWEGMMT